MALLREDVDLAAGVIHVRRGWDAVEGEIATKSGKTGAFRFPRSSWTTWTSTC